MSNIIKMKMSTNPRLLKDVLTLYKSTFYALKELIDNSIQAKAKRVEINLIPSSCSEDSINYKRIESIEVFDDGDKREENKIKVKGVWYDYYGDVFGSKSR